MGRTTTAITLVLVGAYVVGCEDGARHRAIYSSKEACLKDWGTPSSCEQSHSSSGAIVYVGPWYTNSSTFWGRGGGSSAAIESERGGTVTSASESAHFGGFGESGGAHGGVGE